MDVMIREAKKAQPEKEEEKAKYKAKKAKKDAMTAMTEITAGLNRGKYHQGRFCVNRFSPLEAYVGSKSIREDQIIICGRSNMNRAFDGDIVAVERPLPRDQCQEEKALSIAEEEDSNVDEEEEEEDDTFHLAPNSADDAPRTSNLSQVTSGDKNAIPARPSGRVVGVIRI